MKTSSANPVSGAFARQVRRAAWSAFALAATLLAAPAGAVTIDSFTTNQANVVTPGAPTVVTGGADIIGTQRAIASNLLAGAGPVTTGVTGGALNFSVTATTPDSRGEGVLTWDGDTTAGNFNTTGLAAQNLRAGSHSALRIRVNSATAGTELVFEVYSGAGSASRGALRLPTVAVATDFFLSYTHDFVPFLGTGANFTAVTAMQMRVRGTEVTVAVDIVDTIGPSVTATKRDLDLANSPIVAPVLEGSTFKYRVQIGNTAGQAEGVDLTDTVDANTTLNAATVLATPVALNDTILSLGNVDRTSAAPGVLANDVDPDSNGAAPELVVAAASTGAQATALGGSINLAANGSFTYAPPVGVGNAVDTFTYTLQDNDGQTDTAQIRFILGPRIWFVDDAHPGTNVGTSANPFVGFTATNVNGAGGNGDQDSSGDIIFLYSGTYSGNGIVLEAGQTLWGQADALVVDGISVVGAGIHPLITSAASGVTLATDNTLRGFNVGDTGAGGADINGTTFGTLTVSNMTLNGTGRALNLVTGTLNGTFSDLDADSGSNQGILLNAVGGTWGVSSPVNIGNVTAVGVNITNTPAGASMTFSSGLVVNKTSSGTGVFLQTNNAAATINLGVVNITTGSGTGLSVATSSIRILGTTSTINATGGPAILASTSTFVSGAAFATVSSTNSSSAGVDLNTVTGALTISGGAVSGATAVGFDVNAGLDNISYAGTVTSTTNRSVEVTNRTGGTVTFSGAVSDTGTGINLTGNSTGAIVFNGGLVASTATNTAFNATGGGTISVCDEAGCNSGATGTLVNTLTTTTGAAVNVSATTISAAGLEFRSINSATASANQVITLTDTGAGPFFVRGTGSAGSGGTIDNKTQDAIRLSNTDGLVTLNFMIIEDIGDMAGVSNTRSGHDAIQGLNVDGGLSLTSTTIRRISDQAIYGAVFGSPDTATSWTGLTLANVTIEDTNRFHVAGVGDANNEGTIRILGLRGTVSITNSVFARGAEFLDIFTTAGTLTMTVTGSSFANAYKEFTSGTLASVGGHCIDVTVQGAGAANVTIGNRAAPSTSNTFLNCRIASLRFVNDTGSTGNSDFIVARNTFTVNDGSSGIGGDFDFPMGGVLVWNLGNGPGGSVVDTIVENNTFTDVTNASGGVGQLSLIAEGGLLQGLIQSNSFVRPGNAPWWIQSRNTVNSNARLQFSTNTITGGPSLCTTDPSCAGGYTTPGLRTLFDANNGATLDATLASNTFPSHDTGFDPGETVEFRGLAPSGGSVCVNMTNNLADDGYSLEPAAGSMRTVGSGACPVGAPSAACQNVLGNRGNRGGANNINTNPPFVRVFNAAVAVSTTNCSVPNGGPF